MAILAPAGYGINTWGSVAGGTFHSGGIGPDSYTNWADVAPSGGYKVIGSGAVGFVQNHPYDASRVIVYACPEGDEVAVYTRGTARLVNGEARVKLGETFQWVTNPDLGLTAHLTPVGDWADLYVAEKSTTELVVRSHGGSPGAAFDYIVYGLRIGFEEISIVQEKRKESYIPSLASHRERYVGYPDLRAFNALERFKGMELALRGEAAASLDMSRATVLKDAVHEADPATDPPVDRLFGSGPGPSSGEAAEALRSPTVPLPPSAGAMSPPAVGHTAERAAQALGERSSVVSFEPRSVLPSFPVSEAVEAGDVLVMDPAHAGSVARCAVPSDPRVVGIATAAAAARAGAAERTGAEVLPLVAVAMSNVAFCKVDTTNGPIEVGDLLVASATPGHAMRTTAAQPGTVVGKALEPLAGGTGVLKILVMMR
jgi:hypothetical protein